MTDIPRTEQLIQNTRTIWADGNVDLIDAQYAPEFVGQFIDTDLQYGVDDYKRVVEHIQTVVPSVEVTIEELFTTDDLVGSRWTIHETTDSNSEEATAGPPMSSRSYSGIVVSQIQDDIITAEWNYGQLDGLAQLFSDQTEESEEHSESLFYQLFMKYRLPPTL